MKFRPTPTFLLIGALIASLPGLLPVIHAADAPLRQAAGSEAAAPAAAAASAAASAAARPQPDQPPLRPFNEVVRDATRSDGLFTVWRKDERVWIEIPRERLSQPFLFSANIARSVGERGLYASQMGVAHMAQLRLVGRQLQLLAINTRFRAAPDSGSVHAVNEAFSPSLLASAAVASADHPQRKSFLVDASFLLQDIPGYSTRLEGAYRLPFALDRANSSFERARAEAGITSLTARLHFATPRIPAPPLMPTPVPAPTPPQATPDPRSLFVDVVYSLRALPEQPMAPRQADPRLGHFAESFTDLGDDTRANPRVHYIKRWRLEKRDPQAALSEPVKPIVFWLDRNIPPRYRPVVQEGILEWNKAFERIGFRNAIVVRQQPDNADWDGMDAGHATVRWFVGADVGFAIGPSHADPRTGEILDADIGMSDVFGRGARRQFVETVARNGMPGAQAHAHAHAPGEDPQHCDDAAMSAMETVFALDLLEARGDLSADSAEAEAFALASIKGTMMHEVGHVLGLKHNFRGSTTVTAAQLADPAYTAVNGIANSVMEYTPVNLAVAGEKQADFHRTSLGPYDYWAIEYAYKQVPREQEAQELARIAARSTEPQLAYGDDADAGGFGGMDGMDPLINRFDLGDDPLAYYRKRLKLSQELWARVQARGARAGDDPMRLRRSLAAGFGPLAQVAELTAKYVGGMHAERDLPGTTGRAAFRPVDPARQREALRFLATGLFSVDSFRFDPKIVAAVSVDYNEWERPGPLDITALVSRVQLAALDRLMSPGTAQRLLNLPSFVPAAQHKGLISLQEVFDTLQSSVWSELGTNADIDRLRRNLQREYIRRLQALLTRPAPTLPADALSLVRYNATRLESQLKAGMARSGRSVEAQAHLAESLATLGEALRARMQRS